MRMSLMPVGKHPAVGTNHACFILSAPQTRPADMTWLGSSKKSLANRSVSDRLKSLMYIVTPWTAFISEAQSAEIIACVLGIGSTHVRLMPSP
jgi:hypothetical protein